MGLPQLDSCCFVFDLKTGNIIMGCLNALISFSLLAMMIVEAVTVDVEQKQLEELLDIEQKAGLAGLDSTSTVLMVMFLVKFWFDIAFIKGVVSERAGIIRSYLIMWSVFFIVGLCIFFVDILDFDASTVCAELVYIALNVYMILLTYSFYKQINQREEV